MLCTEKLNIPHLQAILLSMLEGVVHSNSPLLSAMLLQGAAIPKKNICRQPQVFVTCQDIEAQLSSTDKGHVYTLPEVVCQPSLICDCTSDA